MQKRGQVTIFIIIGIVLLVTITALYFLKDSSTNHNEILGAEFETIRLFTQDCIESSTLQALKELMLMGGVTSQDMLESDGEIVSYYYKNSKNIIPTKEQIAQSVSMRAKTHLLSCIADFESFTKQGYQVDFYSPSLEIEFIGPSTIVTSNFHLSASKAESHKKFDVFEITIPFDFNSKYETIRQQIEMVETSGFFEVGKISLMGSKQNFQVGFTQQGEKGEEVLVSITFPSYSLAGDFVYQYALEVENPILQSPSVFPVSSLYEDSSLTLTRIPEWDIDTPGIHKMQIQAQGQDLKFSIDPPLLRINPTNGVITLNTADFENNQYVFYVIVQDRYDNLVSGPLYVNVNAINEDSPIMAKIDDISLQVGETFTHKINVLNKHNKTLFEDESYLFDINETTGLFSFTVDEQDVGQHLVRIFAYNDYGSTWMNFKVNVR